MNKRLNRICCMDNFLLYFLDILEILLLVQESPYQHMQKIQRILKPPKVLSNNTNRKRQQYKITCNRS